MSTTKHAHQEIDGRTGTRGISRRTVARGMAWTAPVVLTSVTVPAFAASTICQASHAALQLSNSVVNGLAFTNSDVTAALSYKSTGWGGDMTPGDTGEIHQTPYSPPWPYVKLHHDNGMSLGDTITLTIKFTDQVSKLSLTITDIDEDTRENSAQRWIDHVVVSGSVVEADGDVVGVAFTVTDRKPNVVGAGTATNPFQSNKDENIATNAGDVTLFWAGPVDTVTITYIAAGDRNRTAVGQQIGVGKLSFDNC